MAHADDSTSPQISTTLCHILDLSSTRAVIATGTKSAERDAALAELTARRGLPLVHIGFSVPGRACVRGDNEQAMRALMRLILDDCGARSPVLIQGIAHQPDHVQRDEIFRNEITRRGMRVDENLIFRGFSVTEIIKREMRSLLKRRQDMDAVVAMEDGSALVAIEALTEAGLRVPQDVVVTGFDNFPIGAINWPSVTTVDQNLHEQGVTAARMVLDRMVGAEARANVLTPCVVIPRGSTAVGRGADLCVPQTVENVSRLARSYVTGLGQLMRMSRALMKCRTLDDICQALPEHFSALGMLRAFLVLYENGDRDPRRGDPAAHEPDGTGEDRAATDRARLVFDYRDGKSQPVADRTFAARRLLPECLRGELHQDFLGVQPLTGTRGPLGYLVFEQIFGPVPVVETIAMDLSRTIEVVFSTDALMAHSQTLEQLVTKRTKELVAEVTARRQIERELRVANGELERSVVRDGLTGIANRTALDRHFARCWRQHVDAHAEIAVLMVDVDLFKAYNDRYGHLLGDDALRTIASCLSRATRYPDDLVCRFGGEEFMAVLPFSGERGASAVATRFSTLLAEAAIPHSASTVSPMVTASIGIAVVVPDAFTSPQKVIEAADRALYQAKRCGRNRIVVARAG